MSDNAVFVKIVFENKEFKAKLPIKKSNVETFFKESLDDLLKYSSSDTFCTFDSFTSEFKTSWSELKDKTFIATKGSFFYFIKIFKFTNFSKKKNRYVYFGLFYLILNHFF